MPKNINAKRLILINPTKYLGNFLIAGGLIQDFYNYCKSHKTEFCIVIDQSFKPLILPTMPPDCLIYYPRQQINNANIWNKSSLYLKCLRKIRSYQADLAFVIEEDTVAHRLAQLSNASFKLGCSTSRHKSGYNEILPINYEKRPANEKHRWYSYKEIFEALGFKSGNPHYLKLKPGPISVSQLATITNLGVNQSLPLIAIHAGATKNYKKWPSYKYVELAKLFIESNMQPVLIGAGEDDRIINKYIKGELDKLNSTVKCIDLSNQMNLSQLASFLATTQGIIGNDSGPFHLASALGIPGCTIYGPTEPEIWGPLSHNSKVIQGDKVCVPECRNPSCLFDHRCLKSILPETVFNEMIEFL